MFRGAFLSYHPHNRSNKEIDKLIQEYSITTSEAYHYFELLSIEVSRIEENLPIDYNESMRVKALILNIFRALGNDELDCAVTMINSNYKAILKNAFKCIKLYKNDLLKNDPNFLIKTFYSRKQCFFSNKKYTYDVAFHILQDDKNNIGSFIKSILLSEDYYNVDGIYRLRECIVRSEAPKKIAECFSDSLPNKDIFSMFFSDYKLLSPIIDLTNKLNTPNFKFKYSLNDIMIFMYYRFILDMYIFIFELIDIRPFISPIDDSLKNMLKYQIKIDIVLSKIYNRLDLLLYYISSESMTQSEQLLFLIKRLLDDVCVHEQAMICFNNSDAISKFKAGLEQKCKKAKNEDIIEEMACVALNEWKNLHILSHIQMLEFLKENEKFANALEVRGVESTLIKRLKQICRDNNFPYIEGEDMFTGAGRKKSSSKTTEKPEKKKRTKKMA